MIRKGEEVIVKDLIPSNIAIPILSRQSHDVLVADREQVPYSEEALLYQEDCKVMFGFNYVEKGKFES